MYKGGSFQVFSFFFQTLEGRKSRLWRLSLSSRSLESGCYSIFSVTELLHKLTKRHSSAVIVLSPYNQNHTLHTTRCGRVGPSPSGIEWAKVVSVLCEKKFINTSDLSMTDLFMNGMLSMLKDTS